MNLLQRVLMGFGTVLLLAVSLQLFAPRAVHALVSTLVTVANTNANPVPVHSVDAATPLQPFQASGSCFSEGGPCSASQFISVPAGLTAVAQDVSGDCLLTSFGSTPPPPPKGLVLTSSSGTGSLGNGTVELAPVFESASTVNGTFTSSSAIYTFGRAAILYAASTPAGQGSFSFSVIPGSLGASCSVNISGYFVTTPTTSSAD